MIDDKNWELIDGSRLIINKLPVKFEKLQLFIDLDAKKIEKNFRTPESIGFWELNDYIENLEKSGFSVRKHLVYKNYLFSYPLILLSMVLLGCILSIKKNRVKKSFLMVVIGIIIGIVFHFVGDLVKTLGQTGSLNIFFSLGNTDNL